MSKAKRNLKKKMERRDRVKIKLTNKRNVLRESRKLEKELEEIRKLHEPKSEPFKEIVNDTQHQFSN